MHASKTIPVELSRASSREVESSWRNSGNAAASENIGRVPHGATKLANMKLPPLSAIIEPGEDGWFVATCPELDIVTQGENHEHAVVMLKEAVELWLECGTPEEIAARIAERPPAR
jgi:predicted RNase H-like HicB family nuclease